MALALLLRRMACLFQGPKVESGTVVVSRKSESTRHRRRGGQPRPRVPLSFGKVLVHNVGDLHERLQVALPPPSSSHLQLWRTRGRESAGKPQQTTPARLVCVTVRVLRAAVRGLCAVCRNVRMHATDEPRSRKSSSRRPSRASYKATSCAPALPERRPPERSCNARCTEARSVSLCGCFGTLLVGDLESSFVPSNR